MQRVFFLVSANERITMDNQQWINVHVYIIKHWCQIPILLSLERMEVSATTNSNIIILLKCMVKYGRILCDELGLRWVCFNCYGNFVFQEFCFRITSQFKSKVFFFMCVQMAHETNLAIYCVIQITLSFLHWINVVIITNVNVMEFIHMNVNSWLVMKFYLTSN